MTDTLATASRVSDPGIRNLYSQESRWQSWLDVEAALAKAQAELGIIPADAAQAIVRCAHLELLDHARIKEGYDRTAHRLGTLGGYHSKYHDGRRPPHSPKSTRYLSKNNIRFIKIFGHFSGARQGYAHAGTYTWPTCCSDYLRI